jgi:hypothetical protein
LQSNTLAINTTNKKKVEQVDPLDLACIIIQNNAEGSPVAVNILTGEIVNRAPDPVHVNYINKLVQNPYNDFLASIICSKVRAGGTLKQICAQVGMPSYDIIAMWRKSSPEFRQALLHARKDRGEYFHDMVLDEAVQYADKDDVADKKVRIEAYKWAAERADPELFGTKTKIDLAVVPTMIMVDTGIRVHGELPTVGCGEQYINNSAIVETTCKEKDMAHEQVEEWDDQAEANSKSQSINEIEEDIRDIIREAEPSLLSCTGDYSTDGMLF